MFKQGEVHHYYINYNSSDFNENIQMFGPEVTSWKVGGLLPSTTYTFYLVVDNGAHNVTSEGVDATTDDGGSFPFSTRQKVPHDLVLHYHVSICT